jgi:hypothetical protein
MVDVSSYIPGMDTAASVSDGKYPPTSFRNRIILSEALDAPKDVTERALTSDGDIVLYGPDPNQPIDDAREVRLYGRNYTTPNDALQAGREWRAHISVAFAHVDIGIEIGPDDGTAIIDQYWAGPATYFAHEERTIRDIPKLLIFQTDQEPQFSGIPFGAQRLMPLDQFATGPVAWVLAHPYSLSTREQLAYRLFHASYFVAENPEAAYILLVTAIEALLPPREEVASPELVAVIDELKRHLGGMTVGDDLRGDVLGLLDDDKVDTIGRQGRQLVSVLGTERFDGKKPKNYFTRCYKVRSDLVHGNIDRPSDEELFEALPELRRFVLALLDETVFNERMPTIWS